MVNLRGNSLITSIILKELKRNDNLDVLVSRKKEDR
jgi:hypothetical protein